MAKRGRPINWQKAYRTYQNTVNYYTKTLGTMRNDWYMDDFHQFKERITSQRDVVKNKWSVSKTVSYFAQKASLNEATMPQINAIRRAGEQFQDKIGFLKAVKIFRSSSSEELKYVNKLITENEWYDPDDFEQTLVLLGDAVRNGEITISEMYRWLGQTITDTSTRRDYISQNVFGSD